MIYLLPGWSSQFIDFAEDDFFALMKTFSYSDWPWRLILTFPIPFWHYLIDEQHFQDDNRIIDIFSLVQGLSEFEAVPLGVDNLELPSDVERVYVQDAVLLIKQGVLWGKVTLNQFGFIERLDTYLVDGLKREFFADCGVVSFAEFWNKRGKLIHTDFYDPFGRVVMREDQSGITLKPAAHVDLAIKHFQSRAELVMTILTAINGGALPDKSVCIASMHNSLADQFIEKMPQSTKIIRLWQSDQTIKKMPSDTSIIVTDQLMSVKKFRQAEPALTNQLKLIAMFPTSLDLGQSNDTNVQKIIWYLNDENLAWTIQQLNHILEKDLFSLGWQWEFVSQSIQQQNQLKQHLEDLSRRFPQSGLTDAAEEDEAKLILFGIHFTLAPSVRVLREQLQTARLLIDETGTRHQLVESLAVSTGIPILSKTESLYLDETQNGQVLRNQADLVSGLQKFLLSNQAWNKSLIHSLEIIDRYRIEEILHHWEVLVHG